MRIEFGFLADSAQVGSDGKLHALGAGIDRINAKEFPATHPFMALVVKLRLHPMECDRDHLLEIELWDPDGNTIGPKLETRFRTRRDKGEPGHDHFAQIVLNLFGLEFTRAGDYAFHIVADGSHLGRLELAIRSLGKAPAISIPEAKEDD